MSCLGCMGQRTDCCAVCAKYMVETAKKRERARIIALARKRVEECSEASGHKLEEFALELEGEE